MVRLGRGISIILHPNDDRWLRMSLLYVSVTLEHAENNRLLIPKRFAPTQRCKFHGSRGVAMPRVSKKNDYGHAQ